MKLYYVVTNAYNCLIANHGNTRNIIVDPDHDMTITEADALSCLTDTAEICCCTDSDGWDERPESVDELVGDARIVATLDC